LAAQQFVDEVLEEAKQLHDQRKLAPAAHLKAEGFNTKETRSVLTTEDLAAALKQASSS
jgi:hypothetical protein